MGSHKVHNEYVDEGENDLKRQVGAGFGQIEGLHRVPGVRDVSLHWWVMVTKMMIGISRWQ